MQRRTFLITSALASMSTPLLRTIGTSASHRISFSFDDGFKQSFYRIAEIHEEYGTKACLNVIASGHLPEFQQVDEWILPELMGSFDDWNSLKERGHEIMPHSWKHLNLARQDPSEAKDLIDKCLDYFETHLDGYKNEQAIFNFPFNASTPELEAYLLEKVRAVRVWRDVEINPREGLEEARHLVCTFNGPKNIDQWTAKTVDDFLAGEGGWLIINAHGLDYEGWGPMSTTFYDKLLKRLIKMPHVEITPVASALP